MGVLRPDHPGRVDGVGVGAGREGRPLDGRPLVVPVVPQHDLAAVGAAQDQVGVEPGHRERQVRGRVERQCSQGETGQGE